MFMLLTILLGLLHGFHGQTIQNAKDLKQKIYVTDGYDKTILPTNDQSTPVVVFVSYYLLTLNGIDEVTETMTTSGYLYVNWLDEQLIWDPTTYGNLSTVYWPQKELWKPDLALENSAVPYKPLGDDSLNMLVQDNGYVIWTPFQVFHSTCTVKITYYPYDIQTCALTFVAWGYTNSEVQLVGDLNRGIDLESFSQSPSWTVLTVDWTVRSISKETTISFMLQVQRKPLFVLLTIVLPIMLLSVLNIFAFALPCDGGEKSGYAVTIFLALAVFLTIVQTTLPANSDSIAIFSVYVILMTVMSTFITLIVLLENRACAWDETEVPIPKWIRALAKAGKVLCCGCRKRKPRKVAVVEFKKTQAGKKVGTEKVKPFDDTEEEGDSIETWKEAINGIDVVCFVFWFLYAAAGNVVFIALTRYGSKQ